MSNTSYTSTRTRAARIAAQDIREATNDIRTFSYERAALMLDRAPAVQRDFSLTAYELQQQDWCDMHRGAVASVGSKPYNDREAGTRAVCYPLPVHVKYVRQGHRAAVNVLYF